VKRLQDEMGAIGCIAELLLERASEEEGSGIDPAKLWRHKWNQRWRWKLTEEEVKEEEY
jgi:hypothetical protein